MSSEIHPKLKEVVWGWDQKPSDDNETVIDHFKKMSGQFWKAVEFLDCVVTPFKIASTSTSSGPAGQGSQSIPTRSKLVGVGKDDGWVDAAIANATSIQVEEPNWSADCWRELYGKLYGHGRLSAYICISCLPMWTDAEH